jgi:hypothetical protein
MESLRATQGLLDARVTFQRLTDARIVRGWIVDVEGPTLTVRTSGEIPLREGDRFAARTARLNGDVAFLASLRSVRALSAEEGLRRAAESNRPTILDYESRAYTFEILGQMVPMPATGDPRYVCEPSRVVVGAAEAELRDISPAGLGVVTLTKHRVGERLSVQTEGEGRSVEVEAEVRYCRRLSAHPTLYRVGLRVLNANRVEHARWMAVVKNRRRSDARDRLPISEADAVEPMPIPRPEETGIAWTCLTAPEPATTPPPTPDPEAPPLELWEGRAPMP